MMVSIGGKILIILAVLFTVITQVTPDTCAQWAKTCSYKTADLLSITVDCGNTTARVQWTADDDLSSDTPFILEYNCTNISNGELLPDYPINTVYWAAIGNSKSGSQTVDDPYIGSNGAYCTFGGCVVSSDCWYISEDTPICNPPVETIIVSSTEMLLPSSSVVPKQSVAATPLTFSTNIAPSSSYSSSLYSSSYSSSSSSSTSVTPSTTSSTVSSRINASDVIPIIIPTILVVVFAAVFIVILIIICLTYRKWTKRHQDKLNDNSGSQFNVYHMDEISLTGSVITILQSLEMSVGQSLQPNKSSSTKISTEKDHHENTPTQEFEFTNKTSLTTKISTEKDYHENTPTQEFEFTNKTSLTTKISTEKDHHENTPTQEFEIKETLTISTADVSSDTLNMNISKDVSCEESVDSSEIVSSPDSVSTTIPDKSKIQTLSDSKSEVPNKPATLNFTMSQDGYIDSPHVMVPKIDTSLSVTSTGYLSDGFNSESVTSFPSNHSSGYISPTHSRVSYNAFSQYISPESSTVSTPFDPTNKEGIDFTAVGYQYRENEGCNWGSSDQIDFCDTIGEDTEEMPHCTTFSTDIATGFNNDYVDTNGKILLPREQTNIRKESFDSLQYDIDFA